MSQDQLFCMLGKFLSQGRDMQSLNAKIRSFKVGKFSSLQMLVSMYSKISIYRS